MWANLKRILVPVFVASLTTAAIATAQVSDGGDVPTSDDVTTQVLDVGEDGELEVEEEGELEDGDADSTGSSPTTPTARSTEGCPEGFSGNHGQYVSSTEDRPRNEAAHSPCGKPVSSVHSDDEGEHDDGDEAEVEADDDDKHENNGQGNGNGNGNNGNGNANGHDKQ